MLASFLAPIGSIAQRPRSANFGVSSASQPIPRLWNCSSVKLKPTWQSVHFAFCRTTSVLKSSSGFEPEAEEDHAPLLALGEGLHVAAVVLVVRRVAREGRDALEGRDRLGHAVEGHVVPKTFWNCSR